MCAEYDEQGQFASPTTEGSAGQGEQAAGYAGAAFGEGDYPQATLGDDDYGDQAYADEDYPAPDEYPADQYADPEPPYGNATQSEVDIETDDTGERGWRRSVRELTTKELGALGEDIACDYLQGRRGFEVVERNWTCPAGEADIVAKCPDWNDDGTYVLVEVKTRLALGPDEDPIPELAVDNNKERRYRQIALHYLVHHPEVTSLRFDVIAINIVREDLAKLRHLSSAFDMDL